MSSSDSGYIFASIIGGIMLALIGGGIYYTSSTESLGNPTGYTPAGMSSSPTASWESSSHQTNKSYGGKKTNRRKKHVKKTRKL